MWRQVVAQSPGDNAPAGEVLRYDLGWRALNTMLKAGRSLSGHERNCAFLNTRGGRFADISAAAGIDFIDDGRVIALTDWDHDGDVDFWIANRTGPLIRFLRNNTDRTAHSIEFKLRGTTCNRDAVGARVEIRLENDPTVRASTLQSGGGYLAQSSKWLHFGLGQTKPTFKSIKVRWPDGSEESIPPVAANGRYLITQGQGRAVAVAAARTIAFTEEKNEAPPSSEQARIVLISPVPVPPIQYADTNNAGQSVTSIKGKARLVSLWATWCAPCLAELKEWGSHKAEFDRAGLEILAINVDEDGEQKKIAGEYAKLGAPFPAGFGSVSLANQFDVLQKSILFRQRPLPLPCSFLIDGRGKLRVLYKGPVSAAQLVADTKLLDAAPEDVLAASIPFPGKWLGHPGGTKPNAIAIRFIEGGFVKEAEAYLRQLIDAGDANPLFEPIEAFVLLGAILTDQKRFKESAECLQQAVRLSPHHRQAQSELAGVLMQLDRPKEAVPHYLAALEKRQDDPELHYSLGMCYLRFGALDKAVAELGTSVSLRPSLAAHYNLGNALLSQGKIVESLRHFEAALKFDPDFFPAANNLAWLMSTHADDSIRNGTRAVELAAGICRKPEGRTASHLDTLSAAYAESRRFDEAIESAREAIRLAKAAGDLETTRDVQQRLALYEKGQPYRAP